MLVANDYVPSQTFPNGTFDANITGWTALSSATLARVTTPTVSGSAGSLRITAAAGGAAGAATATGTSGVPVMGGGVYSLLAYVRAASTGRSATPTVRWYDAAGTQIGSQVQSPGSDNSTGWTGYTWQFTAPPNAAYVAVEFNYSGTATSEIHYLDSVSLSLVETNHTLSESVYSDLDLSFTSEQCINSVAVKRLTWDPENPTKTVEATHGSYEDATSVAEWGRRSAEFTVHGIAESEVPAYAAKILARNAHPVVQVNSVTVPIKDAADTSRALMDLGEIGTVTHVAKGINQRLRIGKVTHRITPDKWLVDLEFSAPSSVASPQPAPPVQSDGGVSPWANMTLASGFSVIGGHPTPAVRYAGGDMAVARGLVSAGSTALATNLVIATLPVGYRPNAILRYAVQVVSSGGGDPAGIIEILTDGTVRLTNGPATAGFILALSLAFTYPLV